PTRTASPASAPSPWRCGTWSRSPGGTPRFCASRRSPSNGPSSAAPACASRSGRTRSTSWRRGGARAPSRNGSRRAARRPTPPRAGGVGNPRLVAKNETPLGLGFTVTNRWAYEGKEAYDAKLDNLRALVGGLDTYYMVAVASRTLGVNSVREIREKKLAVKATSQPVGSLGEFSARQL